MADKNKSLNNYTFLLAHGAGADMNSDWMIELTNRLTATDLDVQRFNFPYMIKREQDGKRRPPDRMPALLEAFKAQIALIPNNRRIIIGGKSMGGRVASLLAADKDYKRKIDGVICLGFPFHPPAKPENYRGEHLEAITVSTLILQGERDRFGTQEELTQFPLSDGVQIGILADGDHSFEPRKRSGLTLSENLDQAAAKIIAFIDSL